MYHRIVHICFSLQINRDGRPSVFEARSEIPKIQEAYRSFSEKYKNDIFAKDKRWVFESYYAKSKNRHLVYEFFDTSQGGYHPQMEPAVNTIIYRRG